VKQEMKKLMVALGLILVKVGGKLLLVFGKLAKMLKLGKVGLAAASLAGYSYLFTWQFALLLMFAIGFHEYGHVWAMRRRGIPTKGFYFLPLIGGAAVAEKAFPSDEAESFVGIMGPLWGLALVVVALAGYLLTENVYFGAAAAWMALINLFNLLPINPLDGGRVLKSIGYSIHSRLGIIIMALGLVAGLVAMYWIKSGLFAFILIIGGLDLFAELRRHRSLDHSPLTDKQKDKYRCKWFKTRYKISLEDRAEAFLQQHDEEALALVPVGEWSNENYLQRYEEKFGAELAAKVRQEVEECLVAVERNNARYRPENIAATRVEDIENGVKVLTDAEKYIAAREIMEKMPEAMRSAAKINVQLSPEQLAQIQQRAETDWDAKYARRPSMTKKELTASIVLYLMVVAILFGVIELMHGIPGVDLIHTFLAG